MAAKPPAQRRFLQRTAAALATAFGYHVVDTSRNRREIAAGNLKTEDRTLDRAKRERLIETARDSQRNFAITAWMVRKHLDFVCTHNFHCRAADRGLRNDVEAYLATRTQPDAFDVRGRHPLNRWIRILESRAVIDGDAFGIRLADGSMQAVESIYCRNPGRRLKDYDPKRWESGCYLTPAGKTAAYNFRTEPDAQQPQDTVVPRAKVFQHGYFDRFDQVRGVGLITPGLANAVDLYETLDFAVAKAKVQQLFALAIYQDGATSPAPITTVGQAGETTGGAQAPTSKREIDFGKGPVFLDLEPGEKAEFLTVNGQGLDRDFLRTLCILTLSALDLPYCWLDASDANFFGNRGALILYLQSARQKRKPIVRILSEWTDWQLERAFVAGDLLRPSQPIPYVWQAEGVPFWNPSQEVNAHLQAIDGLLDTRRRVVEETLGKDWDDLLEEAEYEIKEIERRGLAPKPKDTALPFTAAPSKDTDPAWQRDRK